MIVYLIQGQEVKRVTSVILKDDIVPTVNVVSEERLNPALWFKVMVCDSILVDIDHRHVFWTSDRDSEAEKLHTCPLANNLNADRVADFFRTKEVLLKDDANCNFDPFLCELFDIASNVFSQLSLQNFDRDGNVSTYRNTLTLVHSFILPRMLITRQQCDKVNAIRTIIDEHHTRLSSQIEKKNDATRNGERTLKEKRHDFIFKDNFMKSSHISALDQKFVDVLVIGIASDVDGVKKELVQTETELVSLQKSSDKTLTKHTKELKKRKACDCKILEKLMIAHSTLKNSQRSSRVSGYFKGTSEQANHYSIYVQIFSHVETLRSETDDLVKANLKISAVREAIRFTLAEIDNYGESVGYSRQKGTMEQETDLAELLQRPEAFLTVRDKIQIIMEGEKRDYFQGEMCRFCTRIKNKCKRVCDETRMFTDFISSPLNVDEYHTVNSRNNGRSIITSGEDSVSVWQQECKKVSEDVVEHISFTAEQIEGHFKSGVDVSKSNRSVIVYMVYEEYVFLEIMPSMCFIYESSHREQCSHLADWLTKVNIHDIGLNIHQLMKSHTASKTKSKPILTLERVVRNSVLSQRGRQSIHNVEATVDADDVRLLYRQLSNSELPTFYLGSLEIDIPCTDVEGNTHGGSNIQQDKQSVLHPQASNDKGATGICENLGDSTELVCDTKKYGEYQDITRVSMTQDSFRSDERKHNDYVNPSESVTVSPNTSGTSSKYKLTNDSTLEPDTKVKDTDDVAQRVYDYFQNFDSFIKEAVKANSLNKKLMEFTRSMKYIEAQLVTLRKDVGVDSEICLDDILDVAVVLLFRLEKDCLQLFCAHLNLLIDTIPPFLVNSIHEYALVIYKSAFQFLFDQSHLKNISNQK